MLVLRVNVVVWSLKCELRSVKSVKITQPLIMPLPNSEGTFFTEVVIAMMVEAFDGGQIVSTEDTQVMICYASISCKGWVILWDPIPPPKKRSWICEDRADRKQGWELLLTIAAIKEKRKKRHPSAVPTILAKEICDLDFLLYPCLGRASSTHCWIRLMSHAKAGRTDEALNKRNRWESHRMCEQNSQHWLEAIEEYVCPNTVSFLEKIFILFWGEQLQVISPIL